MDSPQIWALWPLIVHGKMATQGCPCGFWNDPVRECRGTPLPIQRYIGRISGPLLDRIDIHIDVPAVRFREIVGDGPPAESSEAIRGRVISARERQHARFRDEGIFSNAAMAPRHIRRYCRIDAACERILARAMTRLGLSARADDRILRGQSHHRRPRRFGRYPPGAYGRSRRLTFARPHLLELSLGRTGCTKTLG